MFIRWIFETTQNVCLIFVVVALVLSPIIGVELVIIIAIWPFIGFIVLSFINWLLFNSNDSNNNDKNKK